MAVSSAACGAKRRKVSPTKDSGNSEAEAAVGEQQPDESNDEAPVRGDSGQYCGLMKRENQLFCFGLALSSGV